MVRYMISVLCVLVIMGTVFPVYAITVKFNSENEQLIGKKLLSDNKFIGLVGDFIEMKEGTHNISINIVKKDEDKYKIGFDLNIKKDLLSVEKYNVRREKCWSHSEVKGKPPKISNSKKHQDVKVVLLRSPDFPKTSPRCIIKVLHAYAPRCEENIFLNATSTPEGAEIWINDEKIQNFQTNTPKLSVPYCGDGKSIHILMRLNSQINCEQRTDIPPDRNVAVNCDLKKPTPIL